MTDNSPKTAGDAQNRTETDPEADVDVEPEAGRVRRTGVDGSGDTIGKAEVDDTGNDDPTPQNAKDGTLYETQPTLKPTLIVLGAVTVLWAVLFGFLMSNPELIGTVELTSIVEIVVHLVFAFILIRLGVRLYVLSRMTYQVNKDHVAREYSLLYRYKRREVPIKQIRATEVQRDPLETILGYGTLNILTAGFDGSLGFVEFVNVPDPEAVRDAINATEYGTR